MAYADWTFYTEVYFGNAIKEDDFPRLAARASDYLDYLTKGLAATKADNEKVKKAMCALAELDQDESRVTGSVFGEEAQIASESVGSWSQSYNKADLSGSEVAFIEKKRMDTIRLYLWDLFPELFRVKSYPSTPKRWWRL